MRALLTSLLFVTACAGPGQQRLAETPTAKTKATPSEAPAASSSDRDREEVVKSFDSMNDAQQAHAEAGAAPSGPAKPTAKPPGKPGSVAPKTQPASPDKP
jgi:hypothetical protein